MQIIVGSDITCVIEHIEIDNHGLDVNCLRHFNKFKLVSLICNVYGILEQPYDIPTLIDLRCNEYILTKENARNLKIYYGPLNIQADLTNVEEIMHVDNRDSEYIDFSSMPNLKIISRMDAKSYIESYIAKVKKQEADLAIFNMTATSFDRNIKLIKEMGSKYIYEHPNILAILTNLGYSSISSYISAKLNNSYHFVKSADVGKNNDHLNITNIVEALIYKIIQLQKETEMDYLITIINNTMAQHEYDDADIIVKHLFNSLNGHFGITSCEDSDSY